MKSAFGIKLTESEPGSLRGVKPTGETVYFWLTDEGWKGGLNCGGIVLHESIGSSSPEACYRSLRGRARNLVIAYEKLGVVARREGT